ncbi:MAG: polysaccharide deacetylase family protein [Deltaproteobacteria bacterium]|nr:polysaccharide deacetylase family protein [Deltaproteobacteria bacterium]
MRIPGIKTARRFADWLSSRTAQRTLVLGYHRIDEAFDDPFGLVTPPELFRRHLEVLAEESSPISLSGLIEGLQGADLGRHSALVTIDDGYADALCHAEPALVEREIPAAVFVATGLLDSVPWWEALAAAIPREQALPDRLSIDVDGRRVGWSSHTTNLNGRVERINELHRTLVDWPQPERDAAIEQIGNELHARVPREQLPRGLTRDELLRLADGGIVEIGAHGVHHSLLASLSADAQRFEIEESKRDLEEILGRPLRAFSYPNGSSSERTRELVRESGFSCAFASHSGVVTASGDAYRLPRFWVGRMEPGALRRLIRYWR